MAAKLESGNNFPGEIRVIPTKSWKSFPGLLVLVKKSWMSIVGSLIAFFHLDLLRNAFPTSLLVLQVNISSKNCTLYLVLFSISYLFI